MNHTLDRRTGGADADLDLPFTVRVGRADEIWRDAERRRRPSHLVVTPVQLHRRNVQRRLREAALPRSGFEFARLVDVAREVNGAGRKLTDDEPTTESLDRIDRLALLRRVLRESEAEELAALDRVVGTPAIDHAERIERARNSLEMVTGFHPQRLAALRSVIEEAGGVAATDARELVEALVVVQSELRRRAAGAVSDTELLRIATRVLSAEPATWSEAYPGIETLSVAGVSMLTATTEDFLRAVGTGTDVDARLYLRRGTGPAIRAQLAASDPIDDPGEEVL